jgi:hypothetical protein
MLPNNALYGFKTVRDYVWMSLSRGDKKVRLALLMSDKKVAEFQKLTQKGEIGLAVESGNEAMDKLEYVNGLVMSAKNADAQTKQIRKQILWAGLAYGEIFHKSEKHFQVDSEKYTKLLTRIDGWNKQQEKNRFTWNY